MFAFIRHAGYHVDSGTLTEEGTACARSVAKKLLDVPVAWTEIRTSPTLRTQQTGAILSEQLHIPIVVDDRVGMDGSLSDLLPPTEPHGIIFVSHLPVTTRMIRAWSLLFKQEEPPMPDVACGYLIDTKQRTLQLICP